MRHKISYYKPHAASAREPHRVFLIVVLAPFVGNLGQDVVRLLLLVFGIADHHLDHRWLKLRQGPYTRAKLLQIRGTVFILLPSIKKSETMSQREKTKQRQQ